MTTKKVLLIIFGGVATLIGLGLGVGGGLLLAFFGGDGYLETDPTSLRTPTYALVSEQASTLHSQADTRTGGLEATVRVTVRSASGSAVFAGVAPSSLVQSYLGESSYDELRNLEFSPLRFDAVRHEGTATPEPPVDRTGWLRQVSGTGEQVLEFDLTDPGADQVVIMNADAAPGVDVSVRIGVRLPVLGGVAIGLLVAAAIFLGGGIFLLVWGIRAKGRPPQSAPAGGGYGPAPWGPGQPGAPPAWGPAPWGPGQPGAPPPAPPASAPPPAYGYPPGAGYPPPGRSPQGYPPPGRSPQGWPPPGSAPQPAHPAAPPPAEPGAPPPADPSDQRPSSPPAPPGDGPDR